jgi:hypothetical protein
VPFVDTPNSVLRRVLGLATPSEAEEEPIDMAGPASASDAPRFRDAKSNAKAHRQAVGRTRASQKAKRTRLPNGSLLPETEYDRPLLETLIEHGGSASSRVLIDAVGVKVKDRLTDLDKENLPSGGIRWENRLQFVRLRLIEEGLMIKESGRGVWAISDKGRKVIAAADKGEG